MISRKDNLLKRPYEEKRFENHRRKVRSALPAIDNRAPSSRYHVHVKLKKNLQERDRLDKIQKNNFYLLQKLRDIKKKCRVDHYWSTPLPYMVKNKVALFETTEAHIVDFDVRDENDNEMEEIERRLEELGIRKTKCDACNPQKSREQQVIEKRIPWEQQKEIEMKRERSKSLPFQKSHLSVIQESNEGKKNNRRIKSCLPVEFNDKKKIEKYEGNRKKQLSSTSPHRLVISRGCLKLSVDFPIDTLVTFQEGNQSKNITGALCHCKQTIPVTATV
ncbi:hypothetical protein WA026_001116 [Henosepilachna vigintioctopunctata]|uniref:Uncharacterized protein n=1 Tax=Henosepilachna vigintioctopunctata TaxID=420089 RepID=A0AAW1V2L3_9CUCU